MENTTLDTTAQMIVQEVQSNNNAAATTAAPTVEAKPTETVVTTETQQQPAVSTFNESDYFNQHFNGLGSSVDEIKGKLTEFSTKEQEYQAKLAELQVKAPANEIETFYIDGLRKGIKPEVLSQLYSLKPEEMSDEARVKYWMKIEKPYLSDDDVQAIIDNDYKVDPDSIDAEVQGRLKTAKLKEASHLALEGLRNWSNKTLNPTPAAELQEKAAQQEAATKQRTDGWNRVLPTLNLGEIKETVALGMFGSKAGEETNVDLSYNVPAELSGKYMKQAVEHALALGYEPTEANLPKVKAHAEQLFWAYEGKMVVKALAQQIQTHLLNDIEGKINNNQLSRGDIGIGADGKVNSAEQRILDQLNKG